MSLQGQIERFHDAAGAGDREAMAAVWAESPGVVNATAGEGVRTALHRAVFGDQVEAARWLLDHGADPNIRCQGDLAYPLHFAVEKRQMAMARLLLERGADAVGEGDAHELGVMGWATAWDYVGPTPELVALLLAHGGRQNVFSAVATGDEAALGAVLEAQPGELHRRMDATNRRRTPLHLAVVKRQAGAVGVLLERGARLEELDAAGMTALDAAGLAGEEALAGILLRGGAKLRLPAAVGLGRTAEAEGLLREDPGALGPGGRWERLLIRAAEGARGAIVERLIGYGADVRVEDDPETAVDGTRGYTALHAAAFVGNAEAVEVLLAHGASAAATDERYEGTPAGWARHAGHLALAERLRR